jgi:hypothetical protein
MMKLKLKWLGFLLYSTKKSWVGVLFEDKDPEPEQGLKVNLEFMSNPTEICIPNKADILYNYTEFHFL